MPIACFDVYYEGDCARAAAVVIERWESPRPLQTYALEMPAPAEYEPGAFYKRELPCLLALIEQIREPLNLLVIDGYVWLGEQKKGLGAHLFDALGIAVVGIAKSKYQQAHPIEVLRGESKNPLYVSCIGTDLGEACAGLANMAGDYRMPAMLKLADQLSKNKV